MHTQADVLSFMDLLDLDEEIVDTRLKSLMFRETYTNKHLKNIIQLMQYKQLINFQEGTECDNENECTFLVKLIQQMNCENAANVCEITTIVLNLNRTSLVNKSEHLLQQVLSDIDASSDQTVDKGSTLLTLKLCDSMLDAVIKSGDKLTLPFLEVSVSSILHNPDQTLRVHFLTSTVPKLFECVQGYNILDVIWDIVKEIPDSNKEMALRILSCLSEYFIPVADKQGKVSFKSEVVYQIEFWTIILFGLCCDDPLKRKLSVYLAKRAIDSLTIGTRDINLSAENKIFSWKCKNAGVLRNEWDKYFTLIDSLEEKQSNIVLPSLYLFEKFTNIEECWLMCPFKLGLRHDNTQVRRKCIIYKLNTNIKSQDEAVMLLEALNDNNIFDDIVGYDTLKIKMINFFSDCKVLTHILKALILVKWSPVPLYHISDVLAKLSIKDFTLEDSSQCINDILKITCNNVLLRKAVHINLFCFIIENYGHLQWRDIQSMCSLFQVKLPNENIIDMIDKKIEIEKDKLDLLKLFIEKHENIVFVLQYIEKQSVDITVFIELIAMKVRNVQDIVNRQYSDKKQCFADAISLAMLYSYTKCNRSKAELIYHTLTREMKLILQYFLSLISSDITLDIKEIILLSNVIKTFDSDDLRETLLQLYKIALVLFTDERSEIDKAILGLFIMSSLREIPVLLTHYKHEMINLQCLLKMKSFDNKQSRVMNAFYEKLCETIYIIVKEEKVHDKTKEILEFIERVTESGGYGCLLWILRTVNVILPAIFSKKDIKFDVSQFVHRMWQEIEELKSNQQYGPCIEEFINLITQDQLLDRPMFNNVITLYCSKILESSDHRSTPLYWLVRKLMSTEINTNRGHLVYILCEILLFSPVSRKDQRITDNLMIAILQSPKYEILHTGTATHFNFQIQYAAISILSKINDPEIYQTITSYITTKIDAIFKNKQRYHGHSQPHRTLLIAVQHLLYMFSLKSSFGGWERVRGWCEELLGRLPHQPSVKVCLEWFIALFYYVKGVKIDSGFIEHLESRKVPLISQFVIIYYIIKRTCKNLCPDEEYKFVLNHLLAHTMGPMYNVRLYAQCISKQLYTLKQSSEHSFMMNLVAQNCDKDKNCTKLEHDYFISHFDIISDLKSSFIYYFVPHYTEVNSEKIYVKLIEEEMKIINQAEVGLSEYVAESRISDDVIFNFDYPMNERAVAEDVNGAGSIQKKYVPWKSMSDIDVYEVSKKKESTSELIVVASLVDKLPNLGGMARTSEVFAVRSYVVSSLRHLQDSQFQALSVSAERWVNVEEVRPGAPLKSYLQSKKAEGYAVVAAEQTSTSCQLNQFKFPKNTVLLLGHEKEGIPCDLLPLMDHCVEIPQQGVVRSLNVHVTAAIFIWEYSRQHVL